MAPIVPSFAATVFLLLALASLAAAFNITRILGEFSDFSTFNGLLSQTKLADEINRRQTITVLAVNNGGMGAITSLPSDVQRKVLAVHVVLDYYDTEKLGSMKNRSAVLTTLFQSTGQATNRMGFINYTRRAADGVMMFGSAEPGAPLTSQMVKSVMSRPYNISVLEVSSAIVPPSIGSGDNSKAHAPAPAHTKTPAPAPTPSKSKKPKTEGAPPLLLPRRTILALTHLPTRTVRRRTGPMRTARRRMRRQMMMTRAATTTPGTLRAGWLPVQVLVSGRFS